MKSGTKVLIGVGIAALILVMWFVSSMNGLVISRENVEKEQGQIETTLQRRCDLIPNLVNTVKGYVTHEDKVFTEIAEARAQLAGGISSKDVEKIGEGSDKLDSALGRLLAITESYPDLKANQQFIALQDELAGTENRITVARQKYNEKVADYNVKVQTFPTNIVAGMLGHYPKVYFEAAEGAKDVPKVDFNK